MKEQPVNVRTLQAMRPVIRATIERHIEGEPGAALGRLFDRHFGQDRTQEERARFFLYCAPIARNVVFSRARPSDPFGPDGATFRDALAWMRHIDRFDCLAAYMIDCHYFLGLSIRQTAEVLMTPPRVCHSRAAQATRRARDPHLI
jgi:hypothetical protein